MSALTRNDRLKRFGTTLSTIWGLWVPLLAVEPVRTAISNHPWVFALQAPIVATITLLIGEIGRSRTDDEPDSSGPAE